MKVIEKESSYWPGYEYIIVEAIEEEYIRIIVDGYKELFYYVPKDFRQRFFVSKSNYFKVGDNISLSWLIYNFCDCFKPFRCIRHERN